MLGKMFAGLYLGLLRIEECHAGWAGQKPCSHFEYSVVLLSLPVNVRRNTRPSIGIDHHKMSKFCKANPTGIFSSNSNAYSGTLCKNALGFSFVRLRTIRGA